MEPAQWYHSASQSKEFQHTYLSKLHASQLVLVGQKTIAHNTRCTQILYPEWIAATISVATVRLGHNFGIVTINQINVDKTGSIFTV